MTSMWLLFLGASRTRSSRRGMEIIRGYGGKGMRVVSPLRKTFSELDVVFLVCISQRPSIKSLYRAANFDSSSFAYTHDLPHKKEKSCQLQDL